MGKSSEVGVDLVEDSGHVLSQLFAVQRLRGTSGRFGDPDASPGGRDRPACPPPEERPAKHARNVTDEEVESLMALRKETDLAIQFAAQAWPEVVPEAVSLRP